MRTPIWRVTAYAVIVAVGLLLALPNIIPQSSLDRLPSWLPHARVALGLDLRGGSQLVLEVDRQALVIERLEALTQDARQALKGAGVKGARVSNDARTVVVHLASPDDGEAARQPLQPLVGSVNISGAPDLSLAVDGATVVLTPTDAGIADRLTAAAEQSIEIVRARIDEIGVAEPTIQRVGQDRILVQLPGVEDPARIRDLLGTTAKLSFHLLDGTGTGQRLSVGVSLLKDEEGLDYPVVDRVELAGDRLRDARAGFDQQTNEPIVSFRFDTAGAKRFAQITSANVGRPFAIVLDDKVLSAPVIREPITGGQGQISGSFTVESASDLAALLRAGALPAKLTVIEERTVGADLGSDAIRTGLATGLAGFALVGLFMVMLYGPWGLLANAALGLNVALTFAGLSLLGATLTLPGIAGVVLGIGLAVDANVLINERIREETRKGRGALAALDAGFDRAYATIVDSNLTALIATALLFWFGSGPVRGFAITMGLGIAISMFTAVSIVRVAMVETVRRRKLKRLEIRPLLPVRLVPEGTRIRFMRTRFLGLAVSAFLSLASVALFFSPGLNYGVDFKGGIQVEAATGGTADIAAFRAALEGLQIGEVSLQELGRDGHVLARVERQLGGEAAQTLAASKVRAAITEVDPAATVERTEIVGPKVSGELASAGVLAVVLASVAMLVYIWVRFEWPFAVGAIATLILDVTKTVGFFALTGLDFNLTAIAALLTLIGYSVNDKVVVYDRMRENMRRYKAMPFRDLIDLSINETLARSLYTSVTALVALLPMAIWGGSAVQSFAVPMVFGIIVAASSSIFIAAPILLFLSDWRRRRATLGPAIAPAAPAVG